MTKPLQKRLMQFLVKQRRVVEYQYSEVKLSSCSKTQSSYTTGQTFTVKAKEKTETERSMKIERNPKKFPCLACDDGATNQDSVLHNTEECDIRKALTYDQKKSKVQCIKHPYSRTHTTVQCIRPTKKKVFCKHCSKEDLHNSLLCPVKWGKKSLGLLAKQPVNNKTKANKVTLKPVLLPACIVRGKNEKQKYGTIVDGCSTDNYVTNKIAHKYKLQSVGQISLEIEGIGGESNVVESNLYRVPIRDRHNNVHSILCYGLDKIANAAKKPDKLSYNKLCNMLGVRPEEVERPEHIDLLISMRESNLQPDKVRSVGKVTLFGGLLGSVIGGESIGSNIESHEQCFLTTHNIVHPSVKSYTYRAAAKEVLTGVTHTFLDRNPEKQLLAYFNE